MKKQLKAKKLWGGRFTKATHWRVEQFTHSLSIDRRLAKQDLLGSIAHAKMLGRTRIIAKSDANRLVRGLRTLLHDLERNQLILDNGAEDIHTAIQTALTKKVGKVAERLHSGRSRNDQVVTALRLWAKEKLQKMDGSIVRLQRSILTQASRSRQLIMPGYTHLRHAQPVGVGHLLVSYLHPLQRDRQRFQDARGRTDELALGSGALTGTGLPIDRTFVAKTLGFSRVNENSVDAVTDRDFVVEILGALSLLGIHLARISEDLLLWSTREFGFLHFKEMMLTGSSMMPQKQNPDFLELIRAGASRVAGNFTAAVSLLKGLPSGYQRDLQLDKEILFEAVDRTESMVEVLTLGFQALQWDRKGLERQLGDASLYATDLAEYLVAKGVPFSTAHRAVGQLLTVAERTGKNLNTLELATFRRVAPEFQSDVHRLLNPSASLRRKRSFGSTHPKEVARAIHRWKNRLKGSAPLPKGA